ncbi:MAG TPA: hypothetical protein VFN55_15075 [Solirubrobacteraceae bacterium]|nr:hypothetical protein [Solirubrobacteraceae bacterium]
MTDRVTVLLSGLCAFLLVLAVLATQLPATPATHPRRVLLVRRVYRTTVVETVVNAPGPTVSSGPVTQSVSSSGAAAAPPAPTTRAS